MAKLVLKDPDKVAITNRMKSVVRYLGEHVISVKFLEEYYGDRNPLLSALAEEDEEKQVTLIEAMSLGLLDRALKGDVRAFEIVRDTIGEKPIASIKVEHSVNTNLSELSEAQLRELAGTLEHKLKGGDENIVDVESADVVDHDPFEDEDEDGTQ